MNDVRAALLEEMLQASPDALIVVDTSGQIQTATNGVVTLFGYHPDELVGRPLDILVPDLRPTRDGELRDRSLYDLADWPAGVELELTGSRKDGSEVAVDVSLVRSQSAGVVRVGAFISDATERRRGEDVLRFVNEISHSVLAGGDPPELLLLVSQKARALVGAAVAWVAVPVRDHIEVAAADGAASGILVGATIPRDRSLAALAMDQRQTVYVEDLSSHPRVISEARSAGLGAAVYLPMLDEDGAFGVLVLARVTGAPQLSHAEVAAAEVYASAAAIVLALGTTRQALEEMRMISEHERIRRDLHDTVIQKLFALGMSLQAAERLAQEPVSTRIRETVDSIDQVIREIRETIFDLNRRGHGGVYLRQQFRDVVAKAARSLGFLPALAFRGPVEAGIGDDLARYLQAVLSDVLASVKDNSGVNSVDVVVAVKDGEVTLSVADNGIGVIASVADLEAMSSRAIDLGGELKVSSREPRGSLLTWTIPKPEPGRTL